MYAPYEDLKRNEHVKQIRTELMHEKVLRSVAKNQPRRWVGLDKLLCTMGDTLIGLGKKIKEGRTDKPSFPLHSQASKP